MTLSEAAPRGRSWPLLLAFLLVLPIALWTAVYFVTNSGLGHGALRVMLADRLPEGAVAFHRLQWGPGPEEVHAFDVVVRDRMGEPAIEARHVGGKLDLSALLDGQLRLRNVAAEGYGVYLAWDAEGTFNLKDAFKKPKEEEEPPKPPEEKGEGMLSLEGIRLKQGKVTLRWPAWGLAFEDVDASGLVQVSKAEGLVIDADLEGGESSADWMAASRSIAFSRVDIARFKWRGQGFSTDGLTLSGPEESRVHLVGGMGFSETAATLDARGSLKLAGAMTEGAIPGPLPEGVELEGLVVEMAEGAVVAETSRAAAGRVRAGEVDVRGLETPFKARYSAGLLAPSGDVTFEGARAEQVSTPGAVTARKVSIASLTAKVKGQVVAKLEGARAAALETAEGVIRDAVLAFDADVGLMGGKMSGKLASAQGTIEAKGDMGMALLSSKAELKLSFAGKALDGALAALVGELMPADARDALAPPVDGKAVVTGVIDTSNDESDPGYRAHFELVALQTEGRRPIRFDGERWDVAAEPPPEPPR